jgi:decaprenylphospho-beta-D-erythro-pentofuranosid-2-ulose 2-reductase
MSSINIDQLTQSTLPHLHFPVKAQEPEVMTLNHQCSLILGAGSGVGRALAHELASRHHDLILSAREQRDLNATAEDCKIRHKIHAKNFEIDLSEPHFAADFHAERLLSAFPNIHHIFVNTGTADPMDVGLSDANTMRSSHDVHFLNLAMLLSVLTKNAERISLKSVLVCSSISAHSPQTKNISFAASKASLEIYCAGLRSHLANQKVYVQTYILGHVDTSLTYGQKYFMPLSSPKKIAHQMLQHLGQDIGQVYYPGYWRFLVLAFQMLPWRLQRFFNRS